MLSKIIKLLIAIAFIALGVWTIYLWWPDLLIIIRGGIGLALIMLGLITFALVAD